MLNTIKNWFEQQKQGLKAFFDVEAFLIDELDEKRRPIHLAGHRYPSFCELLPYQYYDKDSKLFFNSVNAGLLYRVVPLTGANEQIAEQLDNILRSKVSHEFTLQMILVKHNQVGNQIDAFARQFSNDDFENLALLGENLKTFYLNAAAEGFSVNSMVHPRLTHTECFILIDKENQADEQAIKASFAQFRSSFEASLMASKIGFQQGGVEDFLYLINFYLAHNPVDIYPKQFDYDKSQLLKHQVNSKDFDLKIEKDILSIHGVSSKGRPYDTAVSVLTIDKLPRELKLYGNINNTCNIFNPEQSIRCNHLISVIYQVEDAQKAQGKANRKTRDLDKKSKSDYALHVAGTEEQARVWRRLRDDLASQKTSAVKMLYNVVLFSHPEHRARDVESAMGVYAYNDIKLALCNKLQLPYFLVSMPFLFTGHLKKDFSLPTMMWPITSWNATQYMPLLADWSGVGKGILLPTMRDQFACIDPFSDGFGTNYNIAVTGTSGGGKSFFIQMLMLNVLFNGGDIFIIDVGGSYRKLCEALGGVYLEYSNLAMNPFTNVRDIVSEVDDIIALFELLSCSRNGASDDDVGTLREAILAAFTIHGHKTLIDDVQFCLSHLYEKDKETYPSARILAKNLQRYCSDAEHGKAFNAPSQLSPDARIIVVDLKEIEDNKSIRAPVLLSVISQYQRRMFDSDRSKQKMCIIDEAWSFFTGDAIAANFIIKGFRTGRRHKASFVTITQGIEDYYEFSEARAAWENSALKLIFLQEAGPLLDHQKKHETFSEYEFQLLKDFPKAKDVGFSQVLIKANGVSSFHRLFVDEFTRVMLSSDGDDYQAVQNYVGQGLPFLVAVNRVAQEHYGARHAA